MSTELTLEERVAALEARAVPPSLAVLKRKLEQTWQPDASVLLADGSASISLLKDLHVGVIDATWPGGSTASDTIDVPHGFDTIPRFAYLVVMNQASVGAHSVWSLWASGLTLVQFQIKTFGSTPANTLVTPCAWLAIL